MDYGVKNPDINSKLQKRRPFSWFLLACCLITSLGTARLGVWQVERAHEKTRLADAIEALASAPIWTLDDFKVDDSRWSVIHHPVQLEGHWHHELTFFLANRTHQGGVGFWVFSPFVLLDGSWVLVKRGWSPRHPIDPNRPPVISNEVGQIRINGRLDHSPSQLMTLMKPVALGASDSIESKILDNVDVDSLSRRWNHELKAVVLQTDASTQELRRDWPAIDLKVSTHWAYAFQWFALSITLIFLYLWYQWFKPISESTNE